MTRRTTTKSACGTYAGYHAHYRRRETPCEPCRQANAAYNLTRRQSQGRSNRIQISTGMFVELYLTAPSWLQKQVEQNVGDKKLRDLVDWYDANEVAS